MRRWLLLWLLLPPAAFAQTSPNWPLAYKPSMPEWNAELASKQDYVNLLANSVLGALVDGTPTDLMLTDCYSPGNFLTWQGGIGFGCATGGGGSGVTSLSIVSANGFSGAVANPSSTPAVTLSVSVSGIMKGAAGSLVAATPGVDYLLPNGNGSALTNLGYSQLPSIGANQVLGALTATYPHALNIPSCPSSNNALGYALGSGFLCNTISSSGTPGGSSGNIQYNNAGAFGGLTDTQLTTHINPFTSLLSGAAPASGGGTSNFLRGDGTWAAPPGGGTLPYVYAKDHGVTCNGSTDDSAALNTLLATPSHIFLPAGTCKFLSQVTLATSNVWLDGQGQNLTILSFSGIATGDLVVIGNGSSIVSNVSVTNLQITSSSARTGGASLHDIGSAVANVRYVTCASNTTTCVSVDGSTDGLSFKNFFDHIDMAQASIAGLAIGTASTVSANNVEDVWVSNSYFGGGFVGTAIFISQCGGCYFDNVNGVQALHGMSISPGNGQIANIWASNLLIDGNQGDGITFSPTGTGAIQSAKMGNLWVSTNGTVPGHTATSNGIVFAGSGTTTGVSFSSCVVINNAAYGVYASSSTLSDIVFDGCQNGTNSQASNNTYTNYNLNAGTNWSITGGAAGHSANATFPEHASFGIACGGSADYVTITGVNARGNVTGEFSCAPTHRQISSNLCDTISNAGCAGTGATIQTGTTDATTGFKTVTQAFSGSSAANVTSCANSGCDQIAGSALSITGTDFTPPDSAIHNGNGSHRWLDVYAINNVIQTSDARLKKDIAPEPLGLDFILSLKPVEYAWKDGVDAGTHHGLIAQDVETALGARPFAGLHVPSASDDHYGLTYTEFTAPLIRAVQQQNEQIRMLEILIMCLVVLSVAGCALTRRRA